LDGLVYFVEDNAITTSEARVVSSLNDYILEFRARVISSTPDGAGYAGVMSQVYDSSRSVGVMFEEILGVKYVTFHSDGIALVGGQFAFDWGDNLAHTYRLIKNTTGNLVTLFIDTVFAGSIAYSNFAVPPASPVGVVSFGSSTPASVGAVSVVDWEYTNCWRVLSDFQKFVGLWKGSDPNELTGYHLPLKTSGQDAKVSKNVPAVSSFLVDAAADFVTDGIAVGDYVVVDHGTNKGVYTVGNVVDSVTLAVSPPFPMQPSEVDYRIPVEIDWAVPHRYRIVRDPGGGVSVFLDAAPDAFVAVGYNSIDLPGSGVGVPTILAAGLPSMTFGAFDPNHISQTSWDYVRYGVTRVVSELGIVPHHQIMNQRNIMASFEHHKTSIAHPHTNFWSESEGIPPQTDPDFLRDPSLVAYTLLNEGTPLVPSTQTYEVRRPTPTLVYLSSFNDPEDVLNTQSFVLNEKGQKIQLIVPNDVLYNCLQVIETTTGVPDVIAPFGDDCQPDFGTFSFQNTVCLEYDGTTLPELDPTAITPWEKISDDDTHQFSSVFGGILTYGTDGVGTRTLYRNSTPLPDQISLQTEVSFRLRLLQDSSGGLADTQVRFGFSSPGVTTALSFITTPLGERYVLVVDLNNGLVVGGIPFDFGDSLYHTYRLVRDPGTASVQISID